MDQNPDDLIHYGVKGQRWGVRKTILNGGNTDQIVREGKEQLKKDIAAITRDRPISSLTGEPMSTRTKAFLKSDVGKAAIGLTAIGGTHYYITRYGAKTVKYAVKTGVQSANILKPLLGKG
jgi:hypothetical protein